MIVLIHAFALGVTLALASAGVNAHMPENPDRDAIHGTALDIHQHAFDCATAAEEQGQHHLHCHHASPHPQATGGPVQLDDDQPALVARPGVIPVYNASIGPALAVIHISITGPPRFILFGNFRS